MIRAVFDLLICALCLLLATAWRLVLALSFALLGTALALFKLFGFTAPGKQ